MATKTKSKKAAKSKAKGSAKKGKAARPAKRPVRAKSSAAGGPSPKQQFLDSYAREHATTLRVLRALPAGQSGFRPHERSQCAADLVYTMIVEQELTKRALTGAPLFGGGSMPPKPGDYNAAIAQLDKGYAAQVDMIRKTADDDLQKTVQFPVAPGQMGDWRAIDFVWFMLMDQIHHRGQFSVMLRMAGGKVPSIYGPSADEPWT